MEATFLKNNLSAVELFRVLKYNLNSFPKQ